jgi:suppressor for copper-sensitivity B
VIKIIFYIFIIFNINYTNSYANSWSDSKYLTTKLVKGSYKENIIIAIEANLAEGWKIYNEQIQEVGFPSKFIINDNNIKSFKTIFPPSNKFIEAENITSHGYNNQVLFPILIDLKQQLKEVNFIVEAKFALCKEVCIPVTRLFNVNLTQGFIDVKNTQLIKAHFAKKTNITLLIAILSAFLAGIILNFMPCILPVLLLKIVSLLEKRNIAKKSVILSATNIILGIFSVFLALIVFIMTLKMTGHNLGWGLHFQQPIFITSLIFILFLFICNILGWFNFNFSGKISNQLSKATQKKQGYVKDFFTGMLITILATPCSAPFLGTAIGFALSTSYLNIFIIFMVIALGLAFPYILLITFPKILYLLPRPGKWMERLKIIMSLLLFLTIIWLLSLLKLQLYLFSFFSLLVILFILLIAIKYKNYFTKLKFRLILILLFILAISFVFIGNKDDVKSVDNINFNQEYIDHLLNKHQAILVNVTADWCITCKVNEKLVLHSKKLTKFFAKHNIVIIDLDYTKQDPLIYNYLKKFNRYAIPTYIMYNKNLREGKLLNEIITIKYLKKKFINK